jgi:protein ImuA
MEEPFALIDRLRRAAALAGEVAPGAVAAEEDGLPRLARAQLHEIHVFSDNEGASGAGFAMGCVLTAAARPLLWLRTESAEREGGRLHGPGLIAMGLDPADLVVVIVADDAALLRAAADGARCPGLGTVIVEGWGAMRNYDLTASRRLMLAAEASGVLMILLRVGGQPVPSAATTRWGVAPAPSRPLAADAPGAPAYDLELLRRRGGPAGARWRVEWNRDTQSFDPAPLSGARLPLVADRAVAGPSPASVRRAR